MRPFTFRPALEIVLETQLELTRGSRTVTISVRSMLLKRPPAIGILAVRNLEVGTIVPSRFQSTITIRASGRVMLTTSVGQLRRDIREIATILSGFIKSREYVKDYSKFSDRGLDGDLEILETIAAVGDWMQPALQEALAAAGISAVMQEMILEVIAKGGVIQVALVDAKGAYRANAHVVESPLLTENLRDLCVVMQNHWTQITVNHA